jgi:NADH-quinone oxidoreductase subunit F
MITNVTRGVGNEKDIGDIRRLAEFIKDNSLCGLGQNAPNPILSTLHFFKDEFTDHTLYQKCTAKQCRNLVRYSITDRCVGCGACSKVCPVSCIEGELKAKHAIDEKQCIRCNSCFEICIFKAVKKE